MLLLLCASLRGCAAATPLMYPEDSGSGRTLLAVQKMLSMLDIHRQEDDADTEAFVHEGPEHLIDSRGQAQALFIAAAAASQSPPASEAALLTSALQLYNGWRRLCAESKDQQCQFVPEGGRRPFSCGNGPSWRYERFPCLPHRAFDKELVRFRVGSSADADADAIVGMILLVVRYDGEGRAWWHQMGQWAYDSCKSFVHYNTAASEAGDERAVRTGACQRGWSCADPSAAAPAHYRVMRQFMLDFAPLFGAEPHKGERNAVPATHDAQAFAGMLDQLIATSYRLFAAAQCKSAGTFPSEFATGVTSAGADDADGCAASQAADVSVTASAAAALNLALDYVWFADVSSPRALLEPLALNVAAALRFAKPACLEKTCMPVLDMDASCVTGASSAAWVTKPAEAVSANIVFSVWVWVWLLTKGGAARRVGRSLLSYPHFLSKRNPSHPHPVLLFLPGWVSGGAHGSVGQQRRRPHAVPAARALLACRPLPRALRALALAH